MSMECGRVLLPLLRKDVSSIFVVKKSLVFGFAAVLLIAGSAVSVLPSVQAGDVLIAGNHGNKGNKSNDKKHKNSNSNKKVDKSKGNNGVRDHGKGEGRDGAGQGKGPGHKNKNKNKK